MSGKWTSKGGGLVVRSYRDIRVIAAAHERVESVNHAHAFMCLRFRFANSDDGFLASEEQERVAGESPSERRVSQLFYTISLEFPLWYVAPRRPAATTHIRNSRPSTPLKLSFGRFFGRCALDGEVLVPERVQPRGLEVVIIGCRTLARRAGSRSAHRNPTLT